MSYKLRYADFWPKFGADQFLFTRVLGNILNQKIEIIQNPSERVDLEICSVFTFQSTSEKVLLKAKSLKSRKHGTEWLARNSFGYRPHYISQARKRIWFTAENLRPPVGLFDGTISFDISDERQNNLYFPYYLTILDWFDQFPDNPLKVSPRRLALPREPQSRPRKACSFATNLSPSRKKLISIISNSMEVDEYGKSVDRIVESKFDLSTQYGFQICNENSLFPGYVTEKLIESWAAQNIPIWTGLHSQKAFNTDSYLDFTMSDSTTILETISNLDLSQMEYMQSQPLLLQEPSLEPLNLFLLKILA
jgi:hypothetical protein